MDKSKIYITIASIVGILLLVVGAYYATSQPSAEAQAYFEQVKTVKDGDNVKWSKAKKHVLVEFSDLQCPACQAFHTYMKSNIENDKTITDNITFVYKHYPLIAIHPFANNAAYAAEAARNQGKFFEMIDLQFANQKTWASSQDPMPTFRTYAEQLGLDLEKYDADVNSDDIKRRVAADVQLGNEVQVQGTPTFYLDGQRVAVASYEDFKKLLQETAKKPAPTSPPAE